MSRQLSEKQVLEMLGIPDFRHLSKDRIMSFTSALPQMEPQVAIAALQQVPHFADTSLEIMRIYKETVSQMLAEDQENVQSFNASCAEERAHRQDDGRAEDEIGQGHRDQEVQVRRHRCRGGPRLFPDRRGSGGFGRKQPDQHGRG